MWRWGADRLGCHTRSTTTNESAHDKPADQHAQQRPPGRRLPAQHYELDHHRRHEQEEAGDKPGSLTGEGRALDPDHVGCLGVIDDIDGLPCCGGWDVLDVHQPPLTLAVNKAQPCRRHLLGLPVAGLGGVALHDGDRMVTSAIGRRRIARRRERWRWLGAAARRSVGPAGGSAGTTGRLEPGPDRSLMRIRILGYLSARTLPSGSPRS